MSTASVPVTAPAEDVRRNRVIATSTGSSEPSWDDRGGFYTTHLLARIKEHKKLGAALSASRNFALPWSAQRAVVAGEPSIIDSFAKERMSALLLDVHDFPLDRDDLTGPPLDVRRMRRMLTSKAVGLKERNVTTLSNPSKAEALAGMEQHIERAKAGELVLVYASTHGLRGSLRFADEGKLTDQELESLYARAEARGVRLVCIFDACYSGSLLEAVRKGEIERLRNVGRMTPAMESLDGFIAALSAVRAHAQDLANARAGMPPALRLFTAQELSEILADVLRGEAPGVRAWLAETRWLVGQVEKLEQEISRVRALAPEQRGEADQAIATYADALERLDAALIEVGTARAHLSAVGETSSELQALLKDATLVGARASATPIGLANVLDRAQELLRQLILTANAR